MLVTSLAIVGFAASAFAQAVTQLIVPSSTPPAGCENSRQGSFSINIVNVTVSNTSTPTRRSWDIIPKRDLGRSFGRRQQDGTLMMTLTGGVLTDQANRTGYVASNYQFQFDAPPQAGAIYTAGFTMCPNGTLALGGSAVWWACPSGAYNNLYDRNFAEHCYPVFFESVSGAGQVFSTAPPGPESTGPSENTIANGGGTQSLNSTATFGETTMSSNATMTSSEATTTDSLASSAASAASATATGSASSSASASSSSSSGSTVLQTSVLQQVFAWVAGIVGAGLLI